MSACSSCDGAWSLSCRLLLCLKGSSVPARRVRSPAWRHRNRPCPSCSAPPAPLWRRLSAEPAPVLARAAQGLVMPPRVAPTQVVVIPIPTTSMPDDARARLGATVAGIMAGLKAQGVRAQLDDRDNYRPGWKYNHWEVKVRSHMAASPARLRLSRMLILLDAGPQGSRLQRACTDLRHQAAAVPWPMHSLSPVCRGWETQRESCPDDVTRPCHTKL